MHVTSEIVVNLFSEMSLDKVDQILVRLGFKRLGEKKRAGSPMPYNLAKTEWRLITYQHPTRKEKIKLTYMEGKPMVEVNCGNKQRTTWKKLLNIEELEQYFNL